MRSRRATPVLWASSLGCAMLLCVMGADRGDRPDDVRKTDVVSATNLQEATLAQRREFLESLSLADQFDLKQKQERFRKLPADEQQRIRDLHQQIHDAPDRDQLLLGLTKYNQWLRTLPSSQRAEIMSQPPQERLASIKALFEDQLKRRLFASSPLQPDDFNVMKRWVHGYVRRNEDELLKGATPQFRKRWDEAPAHRKFFMLGMMLTRDQDRMKEIPADELAVLTQHLSPQAKKSLEAAGKHERQLLLNWLRLAGYQLRNMAQQKVPNDMELRTFFNSLDDRRKERLESLPPAETKAALTILYQMDRQSASGFGGAAAVGLQPTQRPGAVKLAPNAGTGAKGPTAISPSRTIRKPSLQPRATGTRPFRAIDRRQTDVDSTGGPKKK